MARPGACALVLVVSLAGVVAPRAQEGPETAVAPPPPAGLVGPAGVLHLLTVSFADLVARFAHGLEIWSSIAAVSRTLGDAALHPEVLLLLVLQLAIAASALRALRTLALPERSSSHVPA